jgi:DNA-binding NarL/FixJ family response regulator
MGPVMLQHLLLVEPNDNVAAILTERVRGLAEVHRYTRFESARTALLTVPWTFIAANIQLSDSNGLRLVHLAATAHVPARALVYTDEHDPHFAHEVQQAGAFYETRECVQQALAAYLQGMLPPSDRRDPVVRDRRTRLGGGRRCWDQARSRGPVQFAPSVPSGPTGSYPRHPVRY